MNSEDEGSPQELKSGGHVAFVLSQTSSGSHRPSVDARQTVADPYREFGGQSGLNPSQSSSGSQGPAEGRHTKPAGWPKQSPKGQSTSGGQSAEAPLHVSAGSQGAVDTRQTVVLGSNVSAGQLGETPSQSSSGSQGPAEGRHTKPAGLPLQELPMLWQNTSQEAVPGGSHCSAPQTPPSPQPVHSKGQVPHSAGASQILLALQAPEHPPAKHWSSEHCAMGTGQFLF